MSTKSILVLLFSVWFFHSYGQLKVHSNGTVSIGTTTSSGFGLTVDGYSAIKITYAGSYMRFSSAPANGVISSTADRVAFWESINGHHIVEAQAFTVMSDSSLKTNILPLESGLEKVMLLKPKTYYLTSENTMGDQKLQYGFLAQDVQQILPDIVDSSMGYLGINYDAIIPLLVESVQLQQNTIDSLNGRIDELENAVYEGGVKPKSAEVVTNENGELISLGQNNPNPFKESTSIPYNIPLSTGSAQIIVYDMRGEQLETYAITRFGEGQLIIEGNTFKAGMYLYALIVDGQYIDSKRMILSK